MRRRKYAEKKSASQNRRHIHSAQTTPENSRIFEYNWYLWLFVLLSYTGWPKKVSHYQMVKKLYYIVLKSVSEIRFIRHITVWIKHYTIIPWNLDILCVIYFLTSITMPDPQTSDMRQIQ